MIESPTRRELEFIGVQAQAPSATGRERQAALRDEGPYPSRAGTLSTASMLTPRVAVVERALVF